MGKTRLIAEIAATAKAQGNNVLWSQMIEDPGAPPYFSWLLALRAYLQQCDDESLFADLGSGAGAVADIIPELRDRLELSPSSPPSDSTAARYQLFDSVTCFLLNAAKREPIVILFDNLHLADRSTLALLEYFCQQIVSHPILVVGAYRDSELNRRHPLRPVLNCLSRSTGFAQQLKLSSEDFHQINEITDELGANWLFSFLSADGKKTYCIYEAKDTQQLIEHAQVLGLPADVIVEVNRFWPETAA
jgi:predicted ATPase